MSQSSYRPIPAIGPVKKPYRTYMDSTSRIGPSPYNRSSPPTVKAVRGNPDWFNRFVEPEIDTFKKQPLMQIKEMLDKYLGDPTDPSNIAPGTNLAAGFINPIRRRQLASAMEQSLRQKASTALLDPNLINEAKHYTALADAVKKNPHTTSHFNRMEVLDNNSLPSSIGAQFNTMTFKTTKKLNQFRDNDLAKAMGIQELQTPGTSSLATTDLSNPGIVTPVEIQNAKDKIAEWAQEFMPNPKYRLRTNKDNPNDTWTLTEKIRHELGHGALQLTDAPSANNYTANSTRYGYWLNPDEVRARAISTKSLPLPSDLKMLISPGKRLSSYPKNDYMLRLMNQIEKGSTWSRYANLVDAPRQKANWMSAVDDMTLDMPSMFYDKLTTPNTDWMSRLRSSLR